MVWWTHRTLGRHWSGILELRENHRLISSGPYRHIRHPMYTGFFMMLSGVALLSANLLIALLQIGAFTATYLARVADEEAMMLDRFGDEYRGYMRRTGRLLPRLRWRAEK
jgi:protein-S-isoprenylcysteine O-methyltransferase Ste14